MSRFDHALRELRAALDDDRDADGIALYRAARIAATVATAAERHGHPLFQVHRAIRTIEVAGLALATRLAAAQVDVDRPPSVPAPWAWDDLADG